MLHLCTTQSQKKQEVGGLISPVPRPQLIDALSFDEFQGQICALHAVLPPMIWCNALESSGAGRQCVTS